MLQTSVVRRTVTAALALSLSVGLMACNPPTTPVANAVTAVTVSVAKTSLTVGEKTQATANVTTTGTAAKTVKYTSDSASVTVNETSGEVTAVSVGQAKITACSTVTGFTTKCGTSPSITVAGGTGGGTLTPAVSINFQPTSSAVVAGFTPDNGTAYNTTTQMGWIEQGSANVPLDMAANTRERTGTNVTAGFAPEYYTQVNMQCAATVAPAPVGNACSGGTTKPGAWQYKVVNGTYAVTVSVGEAKTSDFNSLMYLNVESTNFVKDFTPSGNTAATQFNVVTKNVTVSDGLLTVDAIGGQNTKIQFIKIVPAAAQ